MKKVLLDGDLILRGLSDEGEFHDHFIVLWNAFQSAKLEGYITRGDFDNLRQQLVREVGNEAGDRLLAAVRRILRLWPGADAARVNPVVVNPAIDAIITENQQRFHDAETPAFSVIEFLRRYELDALLEQTPEAQPAILDSPLELETLESPKKLSKALTTTLLLLPILTEVWLHKTQLAAILAVAPTTNGAAPDPSASSVPHRPSNAEPVSAVERSPIHIPSRDSSVPASPAGAALLLSALSGIDIQVENDVPLDVRLDASGRAVIVRLLVAGDASASQGNAIAATIRQQADGGSTAQVIILQNGTVMASPVLPGAESGSPPPTLEGQLVATVQQIAPGQLVTSLYSPAQPSAPPSDAGDRPTGKANPPSGDPLLTVRYVDQQSTMAAASASQIPIEIRLDVNSQGSPTMTVRPQPGGSSPPSTNGAVPRGVGGNGGIIEGSPSSGEPFTSDGDLAQPWINQPGGTSKTPYWDGPVNGGNLDGGNLEDGGDRTDGFPFPSTVPIIQATNFPLPGARLNPTELVSGYDNLLGIVQGQPLLNNEVDVEWVEGYEALTIYDSQTIGDGSGKNGKITLAMTLEPLFANGVNGSDSLPNNPEALFNVASVAPVFDYSKAAIAGVA